MEHFRGAAFRFVTIIGRYKAQNKQPNFLSATLPPTSPTSTPPTSSLPPPSAAINNYCTFCGILCGGWQARTMPRLMPLKNNNNKYYRHAKLPQNVGKYLLHSRTRVLVNICIRLLLLFTLVIPHFSAFASFALVAVYTTTGSVIIVN